MRTYKGLLCCMVTAMIGVEGSTYGQTTAQGSAEIEAHQAILEREKTVLSQAMTTPAPTNQVSAPQTQAAVSAQETDPLAPVIDTQGTIDAPIPITGEDGSVTFDAARQKFYEVWGFKPAKSKSARSDTEKSSSTKKESSSDSPEESSAPEPVVEAKPPLPPLPDSEKVLPNGGIPYKKDKEFMSNSVAGDGIKLPPMPDTLMPMGRPKIVAIKPKPQTVAKAEQEKPKNETPPTPEPVALEQTAAVVAPQSEEPQVTVSPFLQWVRENKESAELARQSQERYKSDVSKREPTEIEDVFLKIRFPYVGNQPTPPNGGAVIYSTPNK